MKKSFKGLIASVLCLALGGIYLGSNLKSEKITVNYTKQAVQEVYTVPAGTCFTTLDALKADYLSRYGSELKPLLTYVYKGEQIKTSSGQPYYCDNPDRYIEYFDDVCEVEGYYLDAALTQKIPTSAVVVGDVMNAITPYYNASGCITSYKQITVLYAKCKEVKTCDTNYDKTYTIHYMVDGKEIDSAKATVGESSALLTTSKEGYTFDGWYLDSSFNTKVNGTTTSAITATAVKDDDNCITGYKDVTLYAKFTKEGEKQEVTPTPVSKDEPVAPNDNPETGDNIYIYVILGVLIIVAGGVTIKKLTSK